jgi:hypothetical protein
MKRVANAGLSRAARPRQRAASAAYPPDAPLQLSHANGEGEVRHRKGVCEARSLALLLGGGDYASLALSCGAAMDGPSAALPVAGDADVGHGVATTTRKEGRSRGPSPCLCALCHCSACAPQQRCRTPCPARPRCRLEETCVKASCGGVSRRTANASAARARHAGTDAPCTATASLRAFLVVARDGPQTLFLSAAGAHVGGILDIELGAGAGAAALRRVRMRLCRVSPPDAGPASRASSIHTAGLGLSMPGSGACSCMAAPPSASCLRCAAAPRRRIAIEQARLCSRGRAACGRQPLCLPLRALCCGRNRFCGWMLSMMLALLLMLCCCCSAGPHAERRGAGAACGMHMQLVLARRAQGPRRSGGQRRAGPPQHSSAVPVLRCAAEGFACRSSLQHQTLRWTKVRVRAGTAGGMQQHAGCSAGAALPRRPTAPTPSEPPPSRRARREPVAALLRAATRHALCLSPSQLTLACCTS